MRYRAVSWFALAVLLSVDPSIGHANFGDPLPGLTAAQATRFTDGTLEFRQADTPATGLGPVFNGVSCAGCHNRPRPGGGSRTLVTRFGTTSGGTFDPLQGLGGSALQSRGIGPAGSCNYVGEVVPPQATIVAQRRSTPLFGLGLVNAVADSQLQAIASNEQATTPATAGSPNVVFDVPSQQMRVGRFGWKAQVATLYHFSGEALVNEMGITNHLFPNEQCPQGNCALLTCDPAPDPEDDGTAVELVRDFMLFLAPPPAHPPTNRTLTGEAMFTSMGCASCHLPTLQTGANSVAALDHVTFHPYSDFLVHNMGTLGDGIGQGQATGTQMRTAPLWGLRRQRTFLHDGRTRKIEDAILAHDGQARAARDAFAALSRRDQRTIVVFLRSL